MNSYYTDKSRTSIGRLGVLDGVSCQAWRYAVTFDGFLKTERSTWLTSLWDILFTFSFTSSTINLAKFMAFKFMALKNHSKVVLVTSCYALGPIAFDLELWRKFVVRSVAVDGHVCMVTTEHGKVWPLTGKRLNQAQARIRLKFFDNYLL